MRERINAVLPRVPEIDPALVLEAVNVDEEPEVAAALGITTVPSFVVRNDAGVVLWQHSGRISETRFEQVLRRVAADRWLDAQFNDDAPSADVVFYRTYSRRTDDGERENWAETIERTITDISKLGRFTEEQTQLVMDQAMAQHVMPSGRWLSRAMQAISLKIAAGTSEIQKNIIGERVLGLPKEPRPQAG